MRLISARVAGFAAAVACGAALLGVSPAHATPVSPSGISGGFPGGYPVPIITGTVTITHTDATTTVIQGSSLGHTPLDTGVAISNVASVTNNTNVSISLSVGAVTVAPGATVPVGSITSGDLFIAVPGAGPGPYPFPW